MPKNISYVTIIFSLEGIEKIKTGKKMTKEQSEEFYQHCKKTAANAVMAA